MTTTWSWLKYISATRLEFCCKIEWHIYCQIINKRRFKFKPTDGPYYTSFIYTNVYTHIQYSMSFLAFVYRFSHYHAWIPSRIPFFFKCGRSKCFCKLVNNKMTCHWNKSESYQPSGLQMITWSWLQYISVTLYRRRFLLLNKMHVWF